MTASTPTAKHVDVVSPDSSSVPPPTNGDPIPVCPPPWTLKATAYSVLYWTSSAALPLPDKVYSPLERGAAFADPARSGRALGGVSTIHVVRYTDSPVGPYDEIIVAPGYFELPAAGETATEVDNAKKDKKQKKRDKGVRITRIYVSQRATTWNGRTNWNIPKHLARFEWTTLSNGSLRLRVFPYDFVDPTAATSATTSATDTDTAANHATTYDPSESTPSTLPFFQCVLQAPRGPLGWIPRLPMSTALARYAGINMSLCQPPLPQGQQRELAGTTEWSRVFPHMRSSRTSLVWMGMDQGFGEDGEGEDGEGKKRYVDEHKNFLPGLGKWMLGVKMDDAVLKFDDPETWKSPL